MRCEHTQINKSHQKLQRYSQQQRRLHDCTMQYPDRVGDRIDRRLNHRNFSTYKQRTIQLTDQTIQTRRLRAIPSFGMDSTRRVLSQRRRQKLALIRASKLKCDLIPKTYNLRKLRRKLLLHCNSSPSMWDITDWRLEEKDQRHQFRKTRTNHWNFKPHLVCQSATIIRRGHEFSRIHAKLEHVISLKDLAKVNLITCLWICPVLLVLRRVMRKRVWEDLLEYITLVLWVNCV